MLTFHRLASPMMAGIIFALLAVAAACNSGGEDGPLPAVVEDLAANRTPPSDVGLLESLALQRDDIPVGFDLEFDETSRVENGDVYVAKYFNSALSGDELVEGVTFATIDILVILFDSEPDAIAFLDMFESMTSNDIVASTQQQRHYPVGEEFGIEQVGVEAHKLSFRQVGDGSVAWEVIERILVVESEDEIAFHDFSVTFRRGRAVAVLGIGATQRSPDADEFEALVEVQDVRLKRGLEP